MDQFDDIWDLGSLDLMIWVSHITTSGHPIAWIHSTHTRIQGSTGSTHTAPPHRVPQNGSNGYPILGTYPGYDISGV